MAIQIGLYASDSFAPISLQIGPLGPYIGPNDPHGGIFALGNMFFHKPGSDGDFWVPLKFCHQGGAWGPLLPTRLRVFSICHHQLKESHFTHGHDKTNNITASQLYSSNIMMIQNVYRPYNFVIMDQTHTHTHACYSVYW